MRLEDLNRAQEIVKKIEEYKRITNVLTCMKDNPIGIEDNVGVYGFELNHKDGARLKMFLNELFTQRMNELEREFAGL